MLNIKRIYVLNKTFSKPNQNQQQFTRAKYEIIVKHTFPPSKNLASPYLPPTGPLVLVFIGLRGPLAVRDLIHEITMISAPQNLVV